MILPARNWGNTMTFEAAIDYARYIRTFPEYAVPATVQKKIAIHPFLSNFKKAFSICHLQSAMNPAFDRALTYYDFPML